jgi:thiol-disulfide isomerase/thioredoxin
MSGALFFASVLCGRFIITNGNVEQMISESYETPVFVFIYSSRCGYCALAHPKWERLMAAFSDDPDVIIAEVDVVMHRAAVRRISDAKVFPTFVDLVRGRGTRISIRTEFFDFLRHTESLITNSPICPSYDPRTPHSYPFFVLSLPATPCKVHNSICRSADLAVKQCLRGSRSGSELRMDIFYRAAAALTLNASEITETVALLREFSKEPLGPWDLHGARESSRKVMILVYTTWNQIRSMRKTACELVSEFAVRRMSLAEFHSRQSSLRLSPDEAPALFVSDLEKRQFSGWKNAKELAARRGDPDVRINWEELVKETKQGRWIWAVVGVLVVPALGAMIFCSQIELATVRL